ncbi:phage tail sheath family protein [Dactylosporangium sp. CA-152071]|uniref:phage tail sheath family protein n=1 Tax=Dactylosporangium sp. CA-152071 TaxID=3239933 RepID=UPI003D8AEA08
MAPSYLAPGVYVEEIEGGSRPVAAIGTSVPAFVGLAEQGPFNTPTMVADWASFRRTFGDFVAGTYLGHAVYGWFLNGGGDCYIVRVGAGRMELPSATAGEVRFVARDGLSTGRVTVEVADDEVRVYLDDRLAETIVGPQSVNEVSRLVRVESGSSRRVKPRPGRYPLHADAPAPHADDFVGDAADRTGLGGLESVPDVSTVVVPDLMALYQRGDLDLDAVKAVQLSMIAHCEMMGDRMAVLDPPPGLSPMQALEWRRDAAGFDSKYAALYYPWIRVFDPVEGRTRSVPPSGHIAGVWARTDATRGVHKAPANEAIRGAVDLDVRLSASEVSLLNPVGVNALMAQPGRGIRVWGARTLSSDPAWRHLNVRRLFNHLERSILYGTQWAVFEPNDAELWAKVRRTVAAFLTEQWRRGALFGRTPDEAFFVVCDASNNPAESVDSGAVICEVGVAPVRPAEFIVFRLAQSASGAAFLEG